jgi:uncharacterized protein YbjT (DUF2867 family)
VADGNLNRPILVTGATGKQGSAALWKLRARGFPVRAMTRDPDKPAARELAAQGVEMVKGDFNDAESLLRAMKGMYGVFSMSTPYEQGTQAEIEQGKRLAEVAQSAHIVHFVFTSVGSADQNTGIPFFESKFEIERHLMRLGFPYLTVLRPVFFMENWLALKEQFASGRLSGPLKPDTKLQQVAVADIGGFAVLAFEQPERWYRKAVELAGDSLSGNDVAASFARKMNGAVVYQQIPWDEFERRAGKPLATMYRWFEEQGFRADIEGLRKEYSALTSFKTWLDANWV